MTLETFLGCIGGETVKVTNKRGVFLYDGDKNAIKAYHNGILDKDICMVEPLSKTKFGVRLNIE